VATRLAYARAPTTSFTENTKVTYNLTDTTSYQRVLQDRHKTDITITEEMYLTDSMPTDGWNEPNFKLQTNTQFATHSFHGRSAWTGTTVSLAQLTCSDRYINLSYQVPGKRI
jgi:hypothetical protein